MLTKDMSLGEFVKQLTVKMTKSNIEMPFKDERPWHVLLYEVATSAIDPKPGFLGKLQFDWDGPYPRSRDLSDYLHGLHFTGCVSAGNPSYGRITLDPEVEEIWSSEEIDEDVEEFMNRVMPLVQKEFTI